MTPPAVPDSFRWLDTPLGPVLRCQSLGAVADHLFTTRQLRLSSPMAWDEAGPLLGVARVVTANQVHGRDVLVVDGAPPVGARPDADGLASRNPEIAIAVRAADCVPVLLADRATGAVAAVHAGWRGTAAGIVTAAVGTMAREFGSRPRDLIAAIGPSIGTCCYEVGPDLVDAFAAAGHARHLIDRWFSVRDRGPGASGRGRLFLDVAGANRDQLVLAGVDEANVHDCRLCTAMHLDVLTSYRAEKEKAGRIAGIIRPAARRPPPHPSPRSPAGPPPG